MATFDPQFNSPDVNYLGWSRPTGEPLADRSKGIALEAVGKGIEGGAALADEGMRGVIKEDLRDKIDKERDQFAEALGAVRSAGHGNPADSMAQASDMDLMPDKGQSPPPAVNQNLTRIQNLQSAYSGNKLSETMYYQKLNDIAKSMRNSFPGYRDYIDQEISRITGGNPANEYLRSAISDINRQAGNAQKEQEYYEKAIVNSGYDNADLALQKFKQTGDISWAQNWLARNNAAVGKVDRDLKAFTMSGAALTDLKQRAEIAANSAAEYAATSFHSSRKAIMDDPNSQTSAQLEDWFRTKGHEIADLNPEELAQHAADYTALATRNAQETLKVLKTTTVTDQYGNKQSIYKVLSPQRVGQIIDDTIKSLYDAQMQMLKDKQTGLLASTNNLVAGIGDKSALSVIKDGGSVGDIARAGQAISRIWPAMGPELQKDMLGTTSDIGSQLKDVVRQQKRNIFNQDGRGQYDGNYTLRQGLEEHDKAQGMLKFTDEEKSEAAKELLKMSRGLTEKDPRIQDAAIKAFFDPANRGVLNKFETDHYDPATRKIVRGREGAFQMLTASDILQSVYKRSKETGGMEWEHAKDWTRSTAVSGLTTMAQTWNKNEQDRVSNALLPGGMPSRTEHYFYWDSDKHQIGVETLKGEPLDVETSWRLNPDLFAVRNANIYLNRLKNVAETEGANVDAYLFKAMKDAGWSPRSLDQKGQSKIPANLMEAIIRANGGAQ